MATNQSLNLDFCYVVLPGKPKGQRIGIVTSGELGYHLTDFDHHETEEECAEHVRLINDRLGISNVVEDSALNASMFGWHIPGAKQARDFFAAQVLNRTKMPSP
jgi:hypothetical protein